MDETEINLEKRLRELRRARQLSQEDLAEALGISRQSIIAIEQGKSLPSLPLAISMCDFFNMAFEEMFQISREIEEEVQETLNQMHKITVKPISTGEMTPGKENNMDNNLEPWRPVREAISLRDAVDRLLTDSFITPRSIGGGMPRIDIKERKEDIVVKAELPGIAEEDIEVEVSSDGIVTISGERKTEKEENEEGYHYKESYAGSFSRSFSLPAEVVADKAEADMDKGILTVTIPKARPEKVQKLKVTPKKK